MATLDALLSEARPRWAELEALTGRARGRSERLGGDGVIRLGELYRAATTDLVELRRRLPGDPLLAHLEALVGEARHLVYEGRPTRRGDGGIVAFYSREYWRLIREAPWALGLAALLLLGPVLLGWLWAQIDPGHAAGFAPGLYDGVTRPRPHGPNLGLPAAERGAIASGIFTHNILVSLLSFAGGITAGLVTGYFVINNGLLLGVVGGLSAGAGNTSIFVQLIVPHGLLELSCLTVVSAAGFRLSRAIVAPGDRSRSAALAAEAVPAVKVAVGTAPWLVVAGLVEGLFTPAGLGPVPAVAMGVGLFVLFWGCVLLRGGPGTSGADRRRPPPWAALAGVRSAPPPGPG